MTPVRVTALVVLAALALAPAPATARTSAVDSTNAARLRTLLGRAPTSDMNAVSSLSAPATRPRAHASAGSRHGFRARPMTAVGKIVLRKASGDVKVCTGTIVSRTLVLTAAHCVFDEATRVPHPEILFAPGARPGRGNRIRLPYGAWRAATKLYPGGYAGGDPSLDYALLQLPERNSAGKTVRQAAGVFGISYSRRWAVGSHVYAVGYPASGYWTSGKAGSGVAQYYCDMEITSASRVGRGKRLWTTCPMNGGASGGPWLVRDATGKWVVAGVTSTCWWQAAEHVGCKPFGDGLSAAFLDDRLRRFWDAVLAITGR